MPGRQRRQNRLLHVLRASREHQKQFRGGTQLLILRIPQYAPNLQADGCSAGFGSLEYRQMFPPQPLAQDSQLGGLAAPLRPFEGDKQAALNRSLASHRRNTKPSSSRPTPRAWRSDYRDGADTRGGTSPSSECHATCASFRAGGSLRLWSRATLWQRLNPERKSPWGAAP